MTALTATRRTPIIRSVQTFLDDVMRGFIATTRNSMAVLGLALAAGTVLFIARADLRDEAEKQLFGWLLERQTATQAIPVDPSAVERVTATNPGELPKPQAQVADWLSRKYRVAPEPISALVSEAYAVGEKTRLDPTLILAVMAIESRFNPFAASPVGAQGLMQVLTRVHTDKYEDFGGNLAAFDPVTNLRVGAQVLQDAIRDAGSIEGGLRRYVGAVTTDGSDYVDKVLSEHERLQRVSQGQRVAFNAYQRRSAPATTVPLMPNLPANSELEAEASPKAISGTHAKAS